MRQFFNRNTKLVSHKFTVCFVFRETDADRRIKEIMNRVVKRRQGVLGDDGKHVLQFSFSSLYLTQQSGMFTLYI